MLWQIQQWRWERRRKQETNSEQMDNLLSGPARINVKGFDLQSSVESVFGRAFPVLFNNAKGRVLGAPVFLAACRTLFLQAVLVEDVLPTRLKYEEAASTVGGAKEKWDGCGM